MKHNLDLLSVDPSMCYTKTLRCFPWFFVSFRFTFVSPHFHFVLLSLFLFFFFCCVKLRSTRTLPFSGKSVFLTSSGSANAPQPTKLQTSRPQISSGSQSHNHHHNHHNHHHNHHHLSFLFIVSSSIALFCCCYVMLCYVMLCYVMLCYVMMCFMMFSSSSCSLLCSAA